MVDISAIKIGQQEIAPMSPRTIQLLEHVQSFGFGAAISGVLVIAIFFGLVFGVATGVDIIGWD